MTTLSLSTVTLLTSSFKLQLRQSSALAKNTCSLGSVKRTSKAFGLKPSFFRVSAMAVYKVKLIDQKSKEIEFDDLDGNYILDSAETAGLELPFSCRAGACSTYTGKMVSGSVD